MSSEMKLNKREEAILAKLVAHQREFGLSDGDIAFVKRWAQLAASLGFVGDLIIKFAAALAAMTAIWTWWPKK